MRQIRCKAWIGAMVALSINSTLLLHAAGPNPCGNFEVGGEFLYLQPFCCDHQYAILDPNPYIPPNMDNPPTTTEQVNPIGCSKGVDPSYDAGFRVMLGYVFNGGCLDTRIQYTWLHTKDTRDVRAPGNGGIWASRIYGVNVTQAPPFQNVVMFNGKDVDDNEVLAKARAELKCEYDAFEWQIGARARRGCNSWMRGIAAIHYARVRDFFDVDYRGILHPGQPAPIGDEPDFQGRVLDGSYFRKLDSWLVGPRIGFEYSYDLFCNFGVGARAGVGLLVGRTKWHIQQQWKTISTEQKVPSLQDGQPDQLDVLADRKLDVKAGRAYILSPEIDVRAGINYTFCRENCFILVAEVGYELIAYPNMLSSGARFRLDSGVSGMDCDPFGLHGLYFSLLFQI